MAPVPAHLHRAVQGIHQLGAETRVDRRHPQTETRENNTDNPQRTNLLQMQRRRRPTRATAAAAVNHHGSRYVITDLTI